jgi:hypothetical protein
MTPHTYEVHPAANMFPMMDPEAYAGLRDDIRDNGQQEAITLWRGMLIDGRNRLRACEELKIEPLVNEIDDDADPLAYVLSINLHRRHLDESQRAMVAARLLDYHRGKAKERMTAGKKPDPKDNCPEGTGQSRDKAGEAVGGVSGKSVDRAATVIASSNDSLIAAVDAGKVSVSLAAKAVKANVPAKDVAKALKADNPAKALRETVKPKEEPRGSSPVHGNPHYRDSELFATEKARCAITQLDGIKPDNPGREKAFCIVEEWIKTQESDTPAGAAPPATSSEALLKSLKDMALDFVKSHPDITPAIIACGLENIAIAIREAKT